MRLGYNALVEEQGPLTPEEKQSVIVQPWWQQDGSIDCGVYAIFTFLNLVHRENFSQAVRTPFVFAKVHCVMEYQAPWIISSPEYWEERNNEFVTEARRRLYELFNLYWIKEDLEEGGGLRTY